MTMYPSHVIVCVCCQKPIHDKFVSTVLDKPWHASCVKCFDCGKQLSEKCFARDARIFCRDDFYRRFGPRCSGCSQAIQPSDLVRKARNNRVFHLNCFKCLICRQQLHTGDKLYVMPDDTFICKEDYLAARNQSVGAAAAAEYDEEEDDDDDEDESVDGYSHDQSGLRDVHGSRFNMDSGSNSSSNNNNSLISIGSLQQHAGGVGGVGGHALFAPPPPPPPPGSVCPISASSSPPPPPPSATSSSTSQQQQTATLDQLSASQDRESHDSDGELDGDPDRKKSLSSLGGDPLDDGGPGGNKRRGPRTTIKAKQLEVLKTAFGQTPKPTRHIREQLAKETGLPMRVIQVWFQNKRSKERRMKQMSGRGSKFFLGGSKLRKFGMDDSRFYFYNGGQPDFGGGPGPGPGPGAYPPGPFPGDFYPPHHPLGPFGMPGLPTSMEQPLPMSLAQPPPPLLPPPSHGLHPPLAEDGGPLGVGEAGAGALGGGGDGDESNFGVSPTPTPLPRDDGDFASASALLPTPTPANLACGNNDSQLGEDSGESGW